MTAPRVAFFLGTLLAGGAERVVLHLSGEMARRGLAVDLLLARKVGPLLSQVSPDVRIVELGTRSQMLLLPTLLRLPASTRRSLLRVMAREKLPKVVRSLPLLIRYLERVRPEALLATLPDNVLVSLWAGRLARAGTRIVIREANTQSLNLEHPRHLFDRLFPAFASRWYPHAAAIVAVSNGVADDVAAFTGLPRERVTTIYNPVDIAQISASADAEIDEPWLKSGQPPVVVAVGRLDRQKDYPTLLRAFAVVRRRQRLRLIILGVGPDRDRLSALCGELGVAEDVKFTGLVANPFAYMRRASLFVLASLWEGFPNALLEALACGCPVVSTDCPSGPRELLADGTYGPLVPVGDPTALAEAMLASLDAPPPRRRLTDRAGEFALDSVGDAYLRLMLPQLAPANGLANSAEPLLRKSAT